MSLLTKLLLLCFQLLFVTILSGQEKYRYVHWGEGEGLSGGNHNVMLKDKNGFLWIGTGSGLNRFDGNTFKNYVPDKNKPGAVIDAAITNLIEDSLHNIWVGTNNGLSRYDIKADTFTNFLPAHPVYKFVIPFWATKNDIYCLEGGWTLTAYNIHSFKKVLLAKIEPPEFVGGDDESFHSFYDARSNSLWLPTSYLAGQSVAGLFEVSLTTGKRNFYTWPCFRNIPKHIHRIKDMRYDPNRNVVWVSSTDGLLEFTLDDRQFHPVNALNEVSNQKNFMYPEGINLDPQGRVWWCRFPAGIIIYNPATQSVTNLFSDVHKQGQIALANLYIYCDPDGMVWTSCSQDSRGIYQIIPASLPVIHYTGDTSQPIHLLNGNVSINSVARADHGKLWIGQGDELNIYDVQTGTFQLVSSERDLPVFRKRLVGPVNVDTIHQKALFDIFDQQKSVSELYEMDISTRKCRSVIFKDSAGKPIEPPTDYAIFPYKNNAILVTSVFNKTKGIFLVITDSALARWVAPLVNNFGWLYTCKDNVFIKADTNQTCYWLNSKLIRAKSALDNIPWNAIYYDEKDKTYWVGFGDSLIHYDKHFSAVRRYVLEGTMYGDGIVDITPDNAGHIWMRLNRSISWLNIQTGKITALSERDGFIKRELGGGPLAINGDIYFWDGGIDRLKPDKLVENYPPSFAYFKSLEVNQQPLSLPTGVNNLEKLSLRYNENKISIETGIIDYYTKGGSSIRYKLEPGGKKADWQYASANYTIRYEALPPGKYLLVMQTANAANDFNGPEKRVLISISLPFWKTWWAYSIYALLLVTAAWGFISYRSRNLKKQNKILEDRVNDRTQRLKKSLEDLKSTQAQLVLSEKMASLGELTAGIAHEIQNPLNFVNNFSDVNNELIEELKIKNEKLKIEDSEVNELLGDIYLNNEKISMHGKRADAIVKSMLQHSRATSGKKELTDINALCDEYLRLAYHGLRAKDKSFNAKFETDFDALLPKINVVPQDIGRVILNLINNAFYAVSQKKKENTAGYEPTVSVTTKRYTDHIELRVTDNGNGIPQKVLDKIFQPFFTTKPTGQGTGLGLSLSYDIVKAHGGEISVKTKEGEGTEFIIQFPMT